MKRIFLAVSLLLPLAPALADPGVTYREINASHHAGEIDTAIFYPAETGSTSMMGENGVFYGTPVIEDGTPKEGRFPVILMSHGWGGNYKRMAWLSAGLVDNGAIVVAVNHPNSTTGATGSPEALNHWTRAQDLSAALDAVIADPVLGQHVDASRVYATGFSYGGWTALSLAGVTGNRQGLEALCNDPAQATSHCADILRAGIKLENIDAAKWGTSYKDARVKSVVAIDPALTWGLSPSNIASLDVPVALIGLGDAQQRLHATDTGTTGSNFEALVPQAKVEKIVPAAHFTALGPCKPEGAAILESEKDDPVCTDPPGTDRKTVNDRVIAIMSDHFKL